MRISRERGQAPDDEGRIALSIDSLKSVEEARLALHLTEEAFRKGTNIAKKRNLEFLLWLSCTRDIKNAIKKTRPKDEFFIVSFDDEEEDKHGLPEKGDPLRLEGISLSRI